MLTVVLACSDPVLYQLIEREGFVAIWVIDPPEKKYIFKISRQISSKSSGKYLQTPQSNIFKLSRQIFSNSPGKYLQTDPKLVELPSGWGEGELAWGGGAEAASRKPVCNLDQNQETVWSKQRESKLTLVNVEGVWVWARLGRPPAPTYLPTSPLNRHDFLVKSASCTFTLSMGSRTGSKLGPHITQVCEILLHVNRFCTQPITIMKCRKMAHHVVEVLEWYLCPHRDPITFHFTRDCSPIQWSYSWDEQLNI